MGRAYSKVNPADLNRLTVDAAVIARNFDPETGELEKSDILGITTGTVSFDPGMKTEDFGSDMNHIPGRVKQLQQVTGYEPKASGTFVTINTALAKSLMAAADIDENDPSHLIPRGFFEDNDFQNIWLITNYSSVNGGFLAIELKNVINSEGFKMSTDKDSKGQFAFTFNAMYDFDSVDDMPFDVYIQPGGQS